MCDGSDKQVADRYIRKTRMGKKKEGKNEKIVMENKKKKKSLAYEYL